VVRSLVLGLLVALTPACRGGDGSADAALALAAPMPDAAPAPPLDTPDAAPAPPLESGGYRVELTNDFSWGPGPRLSLAEDGSFTGHAEGTLWECAGALTTAEQAALTDALNASYVLRRGDHRELCADEPIYMLEVTATGGTAAGLTNRFRYEDCEEPIAVLDTAIDRLVAPLRALASAGACRSCPIETGSSECYGDLGGARVCVGTTAHDCAAANDEAVVDCASVRSFQCDAELGWAPPVRWTPVAAVLHRWLDEFGYHSVDLQLTLAVDNAGVTTFDVSDVVSYWRFDTNGAEIPLVVSNPNMWAGSIGLVGAPPRAQTQAIVRYSSGTDPGPVLTATAVQVSVRGRPWDAAPFGPPIDVTIVDGPPP